MGGGRLHIVLALPQATVAAQGPELVGEPDALRHMEQPIRKKHAELEGVIIAFFIVQGGRQNGLLNIVHQRPPGLGLGQGRHRRRLLGRVETDCGGAVVPQQLDHLQAGGESAGEGAGVNGVDMVSLGKGVQSHLPVAVEISVISEAMGDLGVGKAGKMRAHFPQVLAQALGRPRRQIDEDEPFPEVAVDGRQPVLRFLETGRHAGFFLGADEFAAVVVSPGVETTTEGGLAAKIVPLALRRHHRVAPVRAGVVKGANDAILAPDQQHRGAGEIQPLQLVAPGFRQLLDSAHMEPDLLEHFFHFPPIDILRDAGLRRHGVFPQPGVGLGPTAFFSNGAHSQLLPHSFFAGHCPKPAASMSSRQFLPLTRAYFSQRSTGVDRKRSSAMPPAPTIRLVVGWNFS